MFAPSRLGAQMPPASPGRKISEGRDRPPRSRRRPPCSGAMNFLPRRCLRARSGGGWLRDGLDPTLRTASSAPRNSCRPSCPSGTTLRGKAKIAAELRRPSRNGSERATGGPCWSSRGAAPSSRCGACGPRSARRKFGFRLQNANKYWPSATPPPVEWARRTEGGRNIARPSVAGWGH